MLYKLFVDDKDFDTEDGFTLLSYDEYHIGATVKIALENGFDSIRVTEATPEEKLKYDLRRTKQKREEIPDV